MTYKFTFDSGAKVETRFELSGVELSVLDVTVLVCPDWNSSLVQNVRSSVILRVTPANDLDRIKVIRIEIRRIS